MDAAGKAGSWRESDPGIVNRLLTGAVDLHCHSGPSVHQRYFDHYEAMQEAASVGIRALLLKDHWYPTTPVTELLNKHFPQFNVRLLSGVPLNNPVGGLNVHAVDHGIRLGAKLVWMPTFSAANHIAQHRKDPNFKDKFPKAKKGMIEPKPITVLDSSGKLLPEVLPILDLIAAADVVLSSGHLNINEIWPLFDEAKKRGVKRLLCNHPTFIIGASMADIRRLADMGAYIEHSACMFIPGSKYMFFDPPELRRLVEAGTMERTILGSDLGIFDNMHLAEGFRKTVEVCLDLGYSEAQVRKLVSTNAAELMGI